MLKRRECLLSWDFFLGDRGVTTRRQNSPTEGHGHCQCSSPSRDPHLAPASASSFRPRMAIATPHPPATPGKFPNSYGCSDTLPPPLSRVSLLNAPQITQFECVISFPPGLPQIQRGRAGASGFIWTIGSEEQHSLCWTHYLNIWESPAGNFWRVRV